MITVLVLLGQVLELRAREATSGAIKALLDLAPKTARRVGNDGADHEVALDNLNVGDKLRVRPGEKVPVDGIILEGRSSLDESLVTGESVPVTKDAGAKVIAGTLNQSGGFVMRAEKKRRVGPGDRPRQLRNRDVVAALRIVREDRERAGLDLVRVLPFDDQPAIQLGAPEITKGVVLDHNDPLVES